MRVGVIGVGHMGKHYAVNLMKAGYEVVVYDKAEERMSELVKLGAEAAASPREVARLCRIVITALPTPAVDEEVMLGEEGILGVAERGTTIIGTGTVLPETTLKLAAAAKRRELEYLDAPVSGGEDAAKAATLAVVVGGDEEAYMRVEGILHVLGKHVFYAGPSGSGNVVKLVNNLLGLTNLAVLSEGMVLGVKAGVDVKTLYDFIRVSSGSSQQLEAKLPRKIALGNFGPGFRVELAYKDLSLAKELAEKNGVPLFLGNVTHQVYGLAVDKGLGSRDSSAVVTLFEEKAGVKVRF